MVRTLRNLTQAPDRRTVALVFGLTSFLLANFFARLPAVQAGLALSHGALGLALMGLSIGSIAAMFAAARLIARFGAGPVTWWSMVGFAALSPLPALAGNALALGAALALVGLLNGGVAIASSAEAAALEARTGTSMMAGFHAMFSLGGIAGALTGSLAAAAGLSPLLHLALLGAAAALLILSRGGTLPAAIPDKAAERQPAFARPHGPLIGLALLCFATMMCEGAASDWSALHLARDLDAPPALAALGYACFAVGMTLGRLHGDSLRDRLGAVTVATGGALLAALGLGAGLVLDRQLSAVLGFGCLGLGLSGVVPIVFRTAASVPGVPPGIGIAAVASIGFAGFLTGPPVIGLIAEHLGLGRALGLVPALAFVMALAAPRVLRAARPREAEGSARLDSFDPALAG